MIIDSYKIGTSFKIQCTKHKYNKLANIYYDSFGIIKEFASLWGRKPEEVITVKATIIEEDVLVEEKYKDETYDENSIDYFARIHFLDNGQYDISMIYPNIKQYSVCFPGGPDSGRFTLQDGQVEMNVRLKIEER